MPSGVTYGETCAWPGCFARISWRKTWCRTHYKKIPEEDRRRLAGEIFAARKASKVTVEVAPGEPEAETAVERGSETAVLADWARSRVQATGDEADTFTVTEAAVNLRGWLAMEGREAEVAGLSHAALREQVTGFLLVQELGWDSRRKRFVGGRLV